MTSCDHTLPQHQGTIPTPDRSDGPVHTIGHVPDYKHLNDYPVVKSCEIPLGIRDVSLQVSYHYIPRSIAVDDCQLNKFNAAQDPSV